MALTIDTLGARSPAVMGDRKCALVEVTFDSSYPTGGEDLTPVDLLLQQIEVVTVGETEDTGDHDVVYDHTNEKLQAFVGSTGSEVADATDLSSVSVRLAVFGT